MTHLAASARSAVLTGALLVFFGACFVTGYIGGATWAYLEKTYRVIATDEGARVVTER